MHNINYRIKLYKRLNYKMLSTCNRVNMLLLLVSVTGIFIFHFACDWRVNVTSIFLCFSLLTVIFKQLFLFHLPYMDVYFNLPISKFIHIYIHIND